MLELTCCDSYKNDPQIIAMTSLVSAYQRRDVQEAERILKGESLHVSISSVRQNAKTT